MGGAEMQIKYLVEFLVKKNFRVSFIFEDKGSLYGNELGINLIPLKNKKIRKTLGSRWIFYTKKINNSLRELKPDIIYTRFYSSWSGVASIYAKQNDKIHIWALASDNDLAPKRNSIIRPFDWTEKRWVKRAFMNASVIVTQNGLQQRLLKEKFQREGFLFRQSAMVENSIAIKKSTSKITVSWVANLKPLKRPELFLKLVESMKDNSQIEFLMIGRPHKGYDEMIADVENKNSNFRYLGELSNEKVNDILVSSHILVNSSDYEGFSNTFVQAWMRKVVVISFNSNPDYLLTDKELGFVCNDLKKVKEIIVNLSNNQELLFERGERAYQYAIEHHSYEKNIEKLMKHIEYL